MERVILTATEGMVLTNGTVYGKEIYLGDGAENDFYKITEAEYENMMVEQMKKDGIEHILAENANMKATLNLLGKGEINYGN